MFFHFKAFVHKLMILLLPNPLICIAHITAQVSHDYCAKYDPLSDPPFVCHTPFNIGNGNIV